MDVLQYILQSFSGNENLKKFAPVLELALKNGFDFKKMMQNLDVNAIFSPRRRPRPPPRQVSPFRQYRPSRIRTSCTA